jgi:hypothetical protein
VAASRYHVESISSNAMQMQYLNAMCLFLFGRVMAEVCKFTLRKMPCMLRLTQNKWFPMPAEVVKGLQQEEERISQKRTTTGNGQRGGCCACCAPRAEG